MASCKYLDRIELTYVPDDAIAFVKQIGGIESTRNGVKYEIPMESNPRNVDGYRSRLDSDIRKLRSLGCVAREVLNAAGLEWKSKLEASKVPPTAGAIGSNPQGHEQSATKRTKTA